MRKQVTSISPIQTAKVFAVLSLITALPFLILIMAPMMAMPGPKPPFVTGMFLIMPIFYAVFGFIFVAVGAWAYNVLFKYIGGIEFTTEELKSEPRAEAIAPWR